MPPAVPVARKRESKFLLFLLAVFCFSGGIYCGRYFSRSASASSNPVTTHSHLRTAEFQKSIEFSASSVVKADTEAIKEQPVKLTKTAKSEGRTANSLRNEQSNIFSPYGGIQKYLEGQTKLFSDSFRADEEAYLQLGNDLDRNGHLFISLFVSLDCSSSIQTMRTLFSNKDSGCTPDSAHYGLALFMNEWRTKDGLLYLEYGNKGSGCNKINTGYKLDCGKWHHIAVHTNSKGIEVFVDGIRVSRTSLNAFSVREIQPNNGFVFGRYDASDYPLYGNMSRIAFSYSAQELDDEGVQATVMRLMDTKDYKLAKGLVAYFPLTSNHRALDKTVPLLDVVGGRKGEYKVALPAGAEVLEQVRKINADLGTMRDKGAVKTSSQSDDEARERRQVIKDAMSFVWSNYRRYAWGRDELKPVSKSGQDNWGGMGVTLVDSLDTLWLMGLKTEFAEAREWVASKLSFDHAGSVSVFETTIRELGGLLSAFDLSGDAIFLEKAKQLGDRLAKAFDTGSGIACSSVDISNAGGGCRQGGTAVLSEMGTLQVEFRYLSHHTKELRYEQQAMKGFQIMNRINPGNGLFPIHISKQSGAFASQHITFGALGDSFYEYLLKTWLQGGRQEAWLRDMYDRAIEGMIKLLLKTSKPNGLTFISDWNGRGNDLKMDHLVCFMPATLALGALTDPKGRDSPRALRDMDIAKALMNTCYQMYHRSASGLSPEYVTFTGHDFTNPAGASYYILRPETAESLFYLHQITGDTIYRDWAWEIFESINRNCRTEAGFGALRNVNQARGGVDDRMESFFLAETMKYLYLIQDPENTIDLTKYVFNTEAHPLRIFDSTHKPIPP